VLFVDVTDSTRIYESLGDTVALALINGLFGHLGKIVEKHRGAVVKTLGDGMVCTFDQADTAYHAVCEMQSSVRAMSQRAPSRLQVRTAFTFGAVVLSRGDVFGDTVNLCARLAALANPDQILTSAQTVEALAPGLRTNCRVLFPTRLKGKSDEIVVNEVLWRYDPAVTETMNRNELGRAARGTGAVLKLVYRGRTVVASQEHPAVELGRDDACEIVVQSLLVSRLHARVQWRDGNYVLSDLSTNGTYMLADERSSEVELRHEEVVLGDRGYIGLGKSAAHHGDHTVRFRVEPDGA